MYANKVVLVLKSRGQVLREHGESVFLPFGSEYSILIKNKHDRRIAVKVQIDGRDATEDVQLLVEPQSEIELERFIKNGNLHTGNRFKFIERTDAVAAHRGVNVEDGLVQITYQLEKPRPTIVIPKQPYDQHPHWNVKGALGSRSVFGVAQNSLSASASSWTNDSYTPPVTNKHEAGVTAPGSVSTQQFNAVTNVELEPQIYSLILQLKGSQTGTYVTKPVTVQTRVDCISCGQRSTPSAHVKFCSRCGTSLQII